MAGMEAPANDDGDDIEVGAVEWWLKVLYQIESPQDYIADVTVEQYLNWAKIYSRALMEVVLCATNKEVTRPKRMLLATALNAIGSGASH